MKTALSIIGIVFLVLLLAGGVFVGLAIYEGTKLDASSKAYVEEVVPVITAHWDKAELVSRESSEFRDATTDDQLTQLFATFGKLGALKSYDGATGDSRMNAIPGKGVQITAQYIANATYENGTAKIQVTLIQKSGKWELLGFRVDSPLFLK